MPPIVHKLLDSNSVRTLLAVIAIGVTITLFILNRKRKALSYRVVRRSKILRIEDTLQGRVQILLDGQPTTDVSLVLIEIENSGNEPIKESDFVKPLGFAFDFPATVISSRVFASKPRDLGARVVHIQSDNSVQLAPLLLNRGDLISVEILLTQFTGKVAHTARIEGIPMVTVSSGSQPGWRSEWTVWSVLVGLSVLFAVIYFPEKAIGIGDLITKVASSILGVALFAAFTSNFLNLLEKFRRDRRPNNPLEESSEKDLTDSSHH